MDEPRMAESTRGEDLNQTTRQELEKLAYTVINPSTVVPKS
jgi:hypothetical protein